jgi:hypothetical protein
VSWWQQTFNLELQCIAKAGKGHNLLPEGDNAPLPVPVPVSLSAPGAHCGKPVLSLADYAEAAVETATEELGHDTLDQVHQRFAEFAKANGETLTRSDVSDMLKSCYFPGKDKIDLVMNFFDPTGTVINAILTPSQR